MLYCLLTASRPRPRPSVLPAGPTAATATAARPRPSPCSCTWRRASSSSRCGRSGVNGVGRFSAGWGLGAGYGWVQLGARCCCSGGGVGVGTGLAGTPSPRFRSWFAWGLPGCELRCELDALLRAHPHMPTLRLLHKPNTHLLRIPGLGCKLTTHIQPTHAHDSSSPVPIFTLCMSGCL